MRKLKLINPCLSRCCRSRVGSTASFTLIEVMVAMAVFVVGFAGLFLVYGQSVRVLDSLRQVSRAEDVLMANVEYLRTRSWTQLTNVYTTTSATIPSQSSSNLIESINYVVLSGTTNSPVCTHLELLSTDPLRMGLKNAKRDFLFSPSTVTSTTSMIRATVLLSWDSMQGKTVTNSMTVSITKGGMTADVY